MSSPVTKQTLQRGIALAATAALAKIPACSIFCAAACASSPSSATERPYSSRKQASSAPWASANSRRTATQPCTRLPGSMTASHSALRSSATVRALFCAQATVTIGSGRTARPTSPAATAALSSAGWA